AIRETPERPPKRSLVAGHERIRGRRCQRSDERLAFARVSCLSSNAIDVSRKPHSTGINGVLLLLIRLPFYRQLNLRCRQRQAKQGQILARDVIQRSVAEVLQDVVEVFTHRLVESSPLLRGAGQTTI